MSETRPDQTLEEQRETVIGQLTSAYMLLRDIHATNERTLEVIGPMIERLLDVQLALEDENEGLEP